MYSGGHLLLGSEASAVQHHPRMEHLFLTADASGRLRLRDARMAFSPSTNRNQQGVVQRVSILPPFSALNIREHRHCLPFHFLRV